MPQMAPLPWLTLFFLFTVTFIVFIAMNFFMKMTKTAPATQPTPPSARMNWKW